MGVTRERSAGIEFSREFKEYPPYGHFNFVMTCGYTHIKSGNLAFPGGIADQPAQIMEIIELINILESERETDARRKAEKESKKRG